MPAIPRRLFQLWGFKDDFDSLPEKLASLRKSNLKFLLASNTGWSFMLSSPSDVLQLVQRFFEKEDATLITKAFSVGNCHWIQRVDMARFVMLYAMGGLYLDLDVQINEPLDELLAASLILTRGNSENHIELDIVGAKAGDLRILDLIRKQAHNVLKKKRPQYVSRLLY